MNIDYKDGKVKWDLLIDCDETADSKMEDLSEDLLWVEYGDISIDVGWYRDFFCVYVIDKTWGWEQPIAKIPCKTWNDMVSQLQRAIDFHKDWI